jgi:uncharacterized protein YbaR (Trm112 family)
MPADSNKPIKFDESVLGLLACPECLGGLAVVGERLVCAGCGRGYAIVDGIPVLIAERGVKPEK